MKKFIKWSLGIVVGLGLLTSVYALGLPQWNNSTNFLTQIRMLFTSNGLLSGTKVADINNSGQIIFYGPVVDGSGNTFITGVNLSGYLTGYTETDPIRTAISGNYVPYNAVDTGFNNTGSDTIIPSEKAIYDYSLPYRTWIKSGVDIYYTGGDIYGASFIAKGAGAAVIGIRTIAIGNNSYASGNYSVAIGDNAGTFGYSSIAIGVDNRSYAQYSTTLGYSNVSNTIGGVSIGKFSLGITGALLEVGNGTTLLARNNILTLLSNGLGIGTTSPQYALDVSGTMYSAMNLQQHIYHSYGGFTDGLTPLTITGQNVWTKITNASGNLWSGLEFFGMSLSGDEMIIANTGHYQGSVSFSISSTQGDDFFVRIWNVTQGRQEGIDIGQTAQGATNYVAITLPIYLDAHAGDHFIMQIMNASNANDPSIRRAVYNVGYLHN